MNLLALETSSRVISVALLRGDDLFERSRDEPNGGSAFVLPWVRELLDEAGLDLRDLDAIAFGAGPGGFTGLRLACSVAQGLAVGASQPVLGVGSLEALAQASGCDQVYVCVDARMNEVYTAAYRRAGDAWQEVMPPAVNPPEQAPLPPEGAWVGIGDGFQSYRDALSVRLGDRVRLLEKTCHPTAAAVAHLARPRVARGEAGTAASAVPLYVRDKVALTTAERLARGGQR